MIITADSMLINPEPFGVDVEEFFLRLPILAFAAHAFAKLARIEFAAASFANSVKDPIGLGRQFLAQALFEVRSHAARQAQHVDEGLRRTAALRALQQARNISCEARNCRSNPNPNLDSRVGQLFHRSVTR